MRRTLIGKEKVKRVATGKRLGSLRRMVERMEQACPTSSEHFSEIFQLKKEFAIIRGKQDTPISFSESDILCYDNPTLSGGRAKRTELARKGAGDWLCWKID